jgi:hypothetical protein
MRHIKLRSRRKPWPWRWQLVCSHARLLSPLPSVPRIADRAWNDEVIRLISQGFRLTWNPEDCERARSYVCEFCGNDMDLRAFVEPQLGKHTYAYCTMQGCHWWLEF